MAEICENQSMEENDLEDGEIEEDDDEELAGLVAAEKELTKAIESGAKAINNVPDDLEILAKSDQDLRLLNNSTGGAAPQQTKKDRHHNKSSRKRTSVDREAEDWAGNVEKAIASIIKKEKTGHSDEDEKSEENDSDEKRRGKKRRRRDRGKKRKKRKSPTLDNNGSTQMEPTTIPRYPIIPEEDEIDEDEMLCIRGGSPKPVPVPPIYPMADDIALYGQFNEPPYESASSEYDSDYHDNRGKRDRKRTNRNDKRRDKKSKAEKRANRREEKNRAVLQDSNSVCLFYMQGKCHKHLESAPKEILGDYPRLSREGAITLVNATQKKLENQFNSDDFAKGGPGIPSLFDLSVAMPKDNCDQENNKQNENNKSTTKTRSRPSRWGSEKETVDVSQIMLQINKNSYGTTGVNVPQSAFDALNPQDQQKIQLYNMNFKFPGFFSDKGDKDMRVVSNGDIDMRALPTATTNSEKTENDQEKPQPELIKTEKEKSLMDQDMRVLPSIQIQPEPVTGLDNRKSIDTDDNLEIDHTTEEERDLEIDEPAEEERDLKIDMEEDEEGNGDVIPCNLPTKQRELFMRIKAQQKVTVNNSSDEKSDAGPEKDDDWYSDDDEDNNTPLSNVLKNLGKDGSNQPEVTNKTSSSEMKPPTIEPLTLQSSSKVPLVDFTKVDISAEVTKLLSLVKNQTLQLPTNLDLSNIIQTPDLTKPPPIPVTIPVDPRKSRDPRDPREAARDKDSRDPRSRDTTDVKETKETRDPRSEDRPKVIDPRTKRNSVDNSQKTEKISIYEFGLIEPKSDLNDSNRDTDLRSFGDVKSSGRSDTDLRHLNLPFKPIQNYIPATEIDASISSHPPIVYRVHVCDIPRPDYSGLKLSAVDAQTTSDPRIRKIFRLPTPKAAVVNEIASPDASPTFASPKSQSNSHILSPKSSSNSSLAATAAASSRIDPRMQRKAPESSKQEPFKIELPNTLIPPPINEPPMNGSNLDYTQQMQILQNSTFYQGLNNHQKLILNQAINSQKTEHVQQQQQPTQTDPVLAAVLANLGLTNQMNMNPQMNLMSILGANFNMSPSLLGPGPPGLLGTNPNNDFNMGGFGGSTGLLGHSPFQNQMDYGNSYQNNLFNGPGPGGKRGGFRGDNRRRGGRGGNWNQGGIGRGNRGGFQNRNARSNRGNRSRTPP